MKMRKAIVAAVGAALLAGLAGCKPTERNYRAAYDAAQRKREAAAREQMLPAEGLMSVDGPRLRVLDGDTVYVERMRLRTEDNRTPSEAWYLGVGIYRMGTNARANAEALRGEGWPEAQVLKATEGRWITVAASAGSLDSIRAEGKRFKETHGSYPYVGLPGKYVLYNIF